MFADKKTQNVFLARLGIYRNSMICSLCFDDSILKYVKRKSSPDGYYWICRSTCRFSSSLRFRSFFEGSRLPMRTICFIMYKYINRIPLSDIAYEFEIDRGTVSDYTDLVREVVGEYILNNNAKLGGYNDDGSSKIVEIDESFFLKENTTGEGLQMVNGTLEE
ncbi:hypothetical protein DMUE_0591 [Dictyocoela muelleri]|nr:hypothetical protein DMUE_0591 [Dictyocoela muelleri]